MSSVCKCTEGDVQFIKHLQLIKNLRLIACQCATSMKFLAVEKERNVALLCETSSAVHCEASLTPRTVKIQDNLRKLDEKVKEIEYYSEVITNQANKAKEMIGVIREITQPILDVYSLVNDSEQIDTCAPITQSMQNQHPFADPSEPRDMCLPS